MKDWILRSCKQRRMDGHMPTTSARMISLGIQMFLMSTAFAYINGVFMTNLFCGSSSIVSYSHQPEA